MGQRDRIPTRGNPLNIPELITGQVEEKNYSQKITVVGDLIYFAKARIGSAESSSVWQAKLIDTTGGNIRITWADGDDLFNNVATDLTVLTYA